MERLTITTQQKDSSVMFLTPPHPIDQLLESPLLPRQGVLFFNGLPSQEQPWENTPPLIIAGVSSQELAYNILQERSSLTPEELKARFDLAEQACWVTKQLTEKVMGEDYYQDKTAQKELITLAHHIILHPKEEVREECVTWLKSSTDDSANKQSMEQEVK
jgi:hypothetical protein